MSISDKSTSFSFLKYVQLQILSDLYSLFVFLPYPNRVSFCRGFAHLLNASSLAVSKITLSLVSRACSRVKILSLRFGVIIIFRVEVREWERRIIALYAYESRGGVSKIIQMINICVVVLL